MRALVPAIAGLAFAFGVSAASAAPTKLPLIWSDEFDGTALDAAKWVTDEDCWGGGNQERQCYTARPGNLSVSDGMLHITARHEGGRGPDLPRDQGVGELVAREFTSARIETAGLASFRYGRIEVRAKLPAGQGIWPAIWMLSEHNAYGPFPRSGEIDIAEAVDLGVRCWSCRSELHGAVHFGRSLKAIRSTEGVVDLKPDSFHVFAFEWTPKRMIWSVDGKRFYSRSTRKPFDERFHLILNVAVGGRWPEAVGKGGLDPKVLPAAMLVDWVRVYGPRDDAQLAMWDPETDPDAP